MGTGELAGHTKRCSLHVRVGETREHRLRLPGWDMFRLCSAASNVTLCLSVRSSRPVSGTERQGFLLWLYARPLGPSSGSGKRAKRGLCAPYRNYPRKECGKYMLKVAARQ